MSSLMEQQQEGSSSPAAAAVGSRRREDQSSEFNLREWGLKARISRENTNSRRYSASFIRSFREDTRSFRSNITISSTASSPGAYSFRDEIDPSTYSFTTALQALQARSAAYNCWECLSPEGFALNSKWNEAEKYICNPLSGEFPMECLSAKTLSGRALTTNTSRFITMSAPLIFSNHKSTSQSHYHPPSRPIRTRPYNVDQEETRQNFPLQENTNNNKRMEAMMMSSSSTRDVGTQSTPPPELSSSSLSPASTPSIMERSLNREDDHSPSSNAKLIISQQQAKGKDTREEEEDEDEDEDEENEKGIIEKIDENKKKLKQRRGSGGGCLSWISKRQRHREKHKPRKTTFFLLRPNLKGC